MLRPLLLAALLVPTGMAAQIRASERSRLSQTIDGTVIGIDYARPRLKGRAPIFGKVVKWDEVWTPGANWATTLETSKPIQVDGHAVQKGRYSVWLIVRQAGPWTLVLDPDHHRFHEDPPDSNAAQIRVPVTPAAAPTTEVLTWAFPDIRVSGGTLTMQWADTRVSFNIKVEPSYGITMATADAAPLLGNWEFTWLATQGMKEETLGLTLTHEKGSLYASFVPEDRYFGHFVLIRISDGSLIPGLFEKGEIYEVIRDMVIEFKGSKDRPDRFEVRDDFDELIATGKRKN